MKNRIYLPYRFTRQAGQSDFLFNQLEGIKRTDSREEYVNKWWTKELLQRMLGGLSNEIIMSKTHEIIITETLPKEQEALFDYLKFRRPIRDKRIIQSKCFHDAIKPLDNYVAHTRNELTPSTRVFLLYGSLMGADVYNANLMLCKSQLETKKLIPAWLELLQNTKDNNCQQLLFEFNRHLNTYHSSPYSGLGIVDESYKSTEHIWDLENIILNNPKYVKVCSKIASITSPTVERTLRVIKESVLELVEQTPNLVKMSSNLVFLPLGLINNPLSSVFAGTIDYLDFFQKNKRMPLLFIDPFDNSIPEGKYIQEGVFAAGRCKNCGSLNTRTIDERKSSLNSPFGFFGGVYMVCNDCGNKK
jgi:hypothetical protein